MTRLTRWMMGSSLCLTLVAVPVVGAQDTTTPLPGTHVAQATQPGRRGQERHPELRRALRALENAKSALQQGAHDFQGHRVKALELTEQAIKEVQAGLASDTQ